MKFNPLSIEGAYEIENFVAEDERGIFSKTYHADEFANHGINTNFKESYYSKSKKNVLRGMHFQISDQQDKLITVIKGHIKDFCIDLRKNSKTFGKKYSIILSEKNSKSLYIPEGFAHGFCTLDKENYVVYNCSKYRDKNNEIGLMYNDNDLKINWPIDNPIMSKKDKENYSLKELEFIL